jgi:hypothetical protein
MPEALSSLVRASDAAVAELVSGDGSG